MSMDNIISNIEGIKKDLKLRAKRDKLFITEILNDLHKNGFIDGGKSQELLQDWAKELREESRNILPPSKLKKIFYAEVGKENWM